MLSRHTDARKWNSGFVHHLAVVGSEMESCSRAAIERREPPVAAVRLNRLEELHVTQSESIHVLRGVKTAVRRKFAQNYETRFSRRCNWKAV